MRDFLDKLTPIASATLHRLNLKIRNCDRYSILMLLRSLYKIDRVTFIPIKTRQA
ncbi:MAG: hypothetical protein V7K89_12860 [Nostoc sp.]|uniref:hypothetical protein n=1 Tax=Nostoc sp. TaxID=1180 RepID=UPI002FFC47B3